MGKVRARPENGLLYLDFRHHGERRRELTALPDTPENRRKLQRVLERIEQEIARGSFSYAKHFPNSRYAQTEAANDPAPRRMSEASLSDIAANPPLRTPSFAEFSGTWFRQYEIEWRRTYRDTIRIILDRHLLPYFGTDEIASIGKTNILEFRSKLANAPGKRKGSRISNRRINSIMLVLKQIVEDSAEQFKYNSPWTRIRRLKASKPDIEPFTLEQMQRIVATVRPDYRDYLATRFLTGMRTAEINGLKWKYVDFDRREILIRETVINSIEDGVKTDYSMREIQMSDAVFQALKRQQAITGRKSEYVFCNSNGSPIDAPNFTKRVWHPLLRALGIPARRPYQTRHTAATLWLASGENPQWIARQLGHVSTEMLFKVYARFVPNLTRRDGSAFERLLRQHGIGTVADPSASAVNDDFAIDPANDN